MIHFLKKQFGHIVPTSSLFNGMIDVHSHVLFGTDDGADTLEESLEILRAMSACGIKGVFCTPHVMETVSMEEMEHRQPNFDRLIVEAKDIMDIRLAAEYMLEKNFEEKLSLNPATFDGKHILIEMSYLSGSPRLFETVYEIQMKDYTPVLAHPERYLYLPSTKLETLIQRGCLLQLNLPSLIGLYGKRVQERASRWLLNDKYTFVGSDTHSPRGWDLIASSYIEKEKINPLKRLVENNQTLWR